MSTERVRHGQGSPSRSDLAYISVLIRFRVTHFSTSLNITRRHSTICAHSLEGATETLSLFTVAVRRFVSASRTRSNSPSSAPKRTIHQKQQRLKRTTMASSRLRRCFSDFASKLRDAFSGVPRNLSCHSCGSECGGPLCGPHRLPGISCPI